MIALSLPFHPRGLVLVVLANGLLGTVNSSFNWSLGNLVSSIHFQILQAVWTHCFKTTHVLHVCREKHANQRHRSGSCQLNWRRQKWNPKKSACGWSCCCAVGGWAEVACVTLPVWCSPRRVPEVFCFQWCQESNVAKEMRNVSCFSNMCWPELAWTVELELELAWIRPLALFPGSSFEAWLCLILDILRARHSSWSLVGTCSVFIEQGTE